RPAAALDAHDLSGGLLLLRRYQLRQSQRIGDGTARAHCRRRLGAGKLHRNNGLGCHRHGGRTRIFRHALSLGVLIRRAGALLRAGRAMDRTRTQGGASPVNQPRSLVIDCDPGLDDAIAIALAAASPELAVELVTTVEGNAPLDMVTANACSV